MADIAPIRGILYDPTRVDLSKVIAPPYDVIDQNERARLCGLDEHNCVRLILPSGEGDEKYANAAKTLRAWSEEGIVRRDEAPAMYRYHQVFANAELGERPIVRRGFICGVRLRRFDEGGILPHERTLRGPKIDRLNLMRATGSHLSQIFTLFSDPLRKTDSLFEAAEERAPDLEGSTADGTSHRLWRVVDAKTIAALTKQLSAQDLYIADGHHRYETMLSLRDELRERAGGALAPDAAGEFGTMFLANMDDPGLLVFPIHRLVHSVHNFDFDSLVKRASDHFDVQPVEGAAKDAATMRAAIADLSATRPTFAAVLPGAADAVMFSLKVKPEQAGLSAHPSLLDLDVTVLHSLLLDRLLGIDQAALEAQSNIEYVKDTHKALVKIRERKGQVAFFMHPTRVSQVRAVADAGQVMPQKSTYFFPKIASGLVIAKVASGENTAG